MHCNECGSEEYASDIMFLVGGQEGFDNKELVVNTCASCGHQWHEAVKYDD